MTRKAPIRTCIACGASSDKRELARFVRTPAGDIAFDPTGKAAGRGAYICSRKDCFEKARGKRLLDGRLRAKLKDTDYERLEAEFGAHLLEQQAQQLG